MGEGVRKKALSMKKLSVSVSLSGMVENPRPQAKEDVSLSQGDLSFRPTSRNPGNWPLRNSGCLIKSGMTEKVDFNQPIFEPG